MTKLELINDDFLSYLEMDKPTFDIAHQVIQLQNGFIKAWGPEYQKMFRSVYEREEKTVNKGDESKRYDLDDHWVFTQSLAELSVYHN